MFVLNILKTIFLIPGYLLNALWFWEYLNPKEWGSKRNVSKTARMNSKGGRIFVRWAGSIFIWVVLIMYIVGAI